MQKTHILEPCKGVIYLMKDTINDCYVDIFDRKPTQDEIDDIFDSLPTEIVNIAISWGSNDTEFREKVYKWLKENKENTKG